MLKVSIIIPTFNKCNELLKPCIESLIQHTELTKDIEIIIVANGCTDNTKIYLDYLLANNQNFCYIWYDNPLGFAKATNEGIKIATGEYVLLLSNDTIIQHKDWLPLLKRPFLSDSQMGVVGPIMHTEVGIDFIIGFCFMTKKEILDKVGLLDESFTIGGMEDVDLCHRIKLAGYKIATPDGQRRSNFPMIHYGGKTVHNLDIGRDAWEINFKNNQKKLAEKWGLNLEKNSQIKPGVTATISTKDRYFTSLPNCLISIATQTLPPVKIIIFDDGEHKDLRNEEIYKNIFTLLRDKGIEWEVVFSEGKGQVKNHQKALEMVNTEFIWRLDDDNIAEANVLETLIKNISSDNKIGAVAGLVLDPKISLKTSELASNKIEDIYLGMNLQWFKQLKSDLIDCDHLYSTFLFRKEAAKHGYNMELSPKGHREETLFTYEMKRNGWQLLINPTIITWHFRNSQGGIRSNNNDVFLYEHDEKVFQKKLQEWGVILNKYKLIVLDCGLGDSIVFKKILPEIKEKYKDYKIIISNCYQELFEEDIDCLRISIAEAHMLCNIDKFNIYKYLIDMSNQGKKLNLEQAFREMYL